MKKYPWPSESELKIMRRKLARVKGSAGLHPNASALDRAKYEMCKQFIKYMHLHELTQRELAAKIDIPETRVSEIVHHRIWKFSLDRLIEYYEKINPNVSLSVA